MSMYKNIFVNEAWTEDPGSQQILGINGEVLAFGETAFSSVAEAVQAAKDSGTNAIVIKVASGKYDDFTVVTDGEESDPAKVIGVDFNGGTLTTADGEITVADSMLGADAQASILNELNSNNAAEGTIYVPANEGNLDTTLYVGMGEEGVYTVNAAAPEYSTNASDITNLLNSVTASTILTEEEVSTGVLTVDSTITTNTDTQFGNFAEALLKAKDGDTIDFKDGGQTFTTATKKDLTTALDNKNVTFSGKGEITGENDVPMIYVGRYADGSLTIAEGAELVYNGNGGGNGMQVGGYRPADYAGKENNGRGHGTLTVDGKLDINYLLDRGTVQVNKTGVLNIKEGGLRIANHLDMDKNADFIVDGGTVSVTGQTYLGVDGPANSSATEDGKGAIILRNGATFTAENIEVGKDGKLVLNGGELSVDETLVNSGLIQIVDGTLDAVVSGSGTVDVLNGADFTNSKDINAGLLYVGYDSTTKSDTAASRLTVAAGTTVKGGNGLYVREESSMAVDGKVIAGMYYLKGDTTVNAGGEMVFGGVQGVTVKDGAVLTIKGSAYADVNDSEPNKINIDVQSNSALVVDGGKLDTTAAGPYGSNSITIAADADFIITGDSEVRTDSFTGVAKLENGSLTDSKINGGTLKVFGTGNAISGTTTLGALHVGYPAADYTADADVTVTGTLNATNSTVGSMGTLNIGDGSKDAARTEFSVNGVGNWINNSTVRINNADVKFTNALSMTGDILLDNSSITVTWEGQMTNGNSDGKVVLQNNSSLKYTSYFYIGGYYDNGVAALTITDSSFTGTNVITSADAVITLDNADFTASTNLSLKGTINATDSRIDAAQIVFAETGALNITVSADFLSDLAGKFTLVNQSNADAAALDSLEINVAGNKYSVGDSWTVNGVVYSISNGSGNDIVLSADHEKIIVDASYTADTEGYGVYKFSSFTSALQAAANSSAIKEIKIASSIDEEIMPTDVEFLVNSDTVITADEAVTINLKNNGTNYDLIFGSNNNNTITFDKNVTLKLDDRVIWTGYYGNNTDVVIKGTISAKQWWNGNDTTVEVGGKLIASGEAMVFRRGATLTINGDAAQGAAAADRAVQLDANYFNFLSGNLKANNTLIESGAIWVANTGNYAYEGSVSIELDNTIMNSTGNLKLNSDSVALMTVENGSILNVTDFDGYGASEIGENGSLWVYDSQATLKNINNAGDIDIADSTFTVTGTLNNSGTVAVSGESTLNIGSLTGSSSIDLLDGAIIKDSTVGGTATVLGNVIFRGDNTFTMVDDYGAAYSETSAFWTVEAGSSLTITSGDRYGLGYGDKAAVYGELEDARKIDRTTLTVEDASLNFYGGLVGMSNWDTKQEFTVQDAYVRFGIEKDKSFGNKAGNYYGTYEYNVDNSVFEAKGFKFYEAQSQSTFNAADSQIYVHGVFMTNDADSVFNFTNTTITSNATSNGTDDKNQNAGEMNFVKSDITYNAAFTNIGKITTDAASSITATAVVNSGSINSNLENTAKIIGDFTVAGNFATGDLIIGKNGALSAGSITVDNLTLEIGGELTLTGSGSSIAAEYITVTGSIASAEYQLVLNGWSGDLLNKTVKFDADGNGKIDSDELFTVKSDAANLSGVNFVAQDGKLYVKDFGAAKTSIYICGDLANAADGTPVEVDGVTYTVGKDAFASVENALASSDVKAENITEITVGNGDHINDIAEKFVNVDKIIVPADKEIIDDAASEFQGDLVIDNDGHLEAKITAAGKVTMTNTSSNTFVGELTGADVDVVNTSTGKVEDATLSADKLGGGTLSVDNQGVIEDTKFIAQDGIVNVSGNGTFTNVDVTTDALYLGGIDFTLDADSDVKSVYMGSADAKTLTVDGAKIDQVLGGALDASGTVDFKSAGTESGLKYTTIEDVDKVVLSGGSHEFGSADAYREYYMNTLEMANADLTWNWTDAQNLEYNIGTPRNNDEGMIKVTNTAADATLNFNQNGEYSLGDFDVSGFNGVVNVDDASDSVKSTLTLKENTDYFKNGATINISKDGTLNLNGAGNQGNSDFDVDFNGAGTINVNAVHYLGAEGTINDFTGTINLGSNRIDLEAKNTTAAKFTGDSDAKLYAWGADQEYTLDGAFDEFAGMIGTADGATVTISGENTTDAVLGHRWDNNTGHYIFTADQTFNSDGALNGVLGANNSSITVDSAADLTLKGENSVSAVLKGAGDVIADANQTFTGNVSAFTGTYTANADTTSGNDYTVTFKAAATLAGSMTLNGAGAFVLEGNGKNVTVNSDNSKTDLSIAGNTITLDSGTYEDVTGDNSGSKLIVNNAITADTVTVDALVINAGKSLTAGSVTANSTYVYILNPGEQGPAITVTDNSSSFGDISVNSWSSAFTTPFTIVNSVTGQVYTDTVVFILGVGAGTGLTVDGLAQEIDGKFVRVYTQDGDLLIGNYNGTSNAVYVNSDWSTVSGTVEKWTVSNTGTANDTDRIIDRDASKTLENAVKIIRAEADGKGQIFVVKGDTYSTPAALMTADNKVTDLVIEGKGFEEFNNAQAAVEVGDAVIEGGIVAQESAMDGSLTLRNVSVSGNIYGGAAVSADATVNGGSKLIMDGGYYLSSQIAAGSYVTAGTLEVESSELVIKNNTAGEMIILGRVLGGSVAAGQGTVVQETASISISAPETAPGTTNKKITIRGDIYAAGSGDVTVANSKVTFSGNGANLDFTGRVSGQAFGNNAATGEAELVFADYAGKFMGLIQDMDVITISGSTAVEFTRKQTLTAETDFVFALDGSTVENTAMFTVNSFGWTYGDTITVNAFNGVSNTANNEYILAEGWDFSTGFTFNVAGTAGYTLGDTVTVGSTEYILTAQDNKLTLKYTNSSGMVTTGDTAEIAADTTLTGTDALAGVSKVELGADATLKMDLSAANLSGKEFTTEAGKEATVEVKTDSTDWNYVSGGMTVGEGVTANIKGKVVGYDDINIDGEVNMLEGEKSYLFMLGGELNVSETGKLNAGSSTLQIKGGSTATIEGEVKAVHTNVWGSGKSQMVIDGGSLTCHNGDGKVWLNLYAGGHDLTMKNGGELTVSEVKLNQDGSQSDDPTKASTLSVLSGSTVNGNIVAAGMDDTVTLDVDAILNGNLNLGDGTDTLNVNGFDGLDKSNGAVSIANTVTSVENFKIDNIDAILGTAVQLEGADTAGATEDDVWAALGAVDGNLVVAWGNTEAEVGAALDAFDKFDATIGTVLVADSSDTFQSLDHDDFIDKKNNGTLA